MNKWVKTSGMIAILAFGLSACSTQQVASSAIGVAKLPVKMIGAAGRAAGGVAGGAVGGLVGGNMGRRVGSTVGRAVGGYAVGK